MKTRSLAVVLAIISCLPGLAGAQNQSMNSDSLTIDQAVALAIDHNPSMRAAAANIQSASAGLTQAQSTYYPTITAVGSATRTGGIVVLNPNVSSQDRTYNTYTAGLQASQTILDFGRMVSRVSAGNDLLSASETDFRSNRDNVIMNVQIAYFTVMQAEQVAAVNKEAVDRAADHLREARAFYSVGKRAQFDVTRAEVDLANANVNLISASNQLRLARVQLENAMGVHPSTAYAVTHEFTIPDFSMGLDSVKVLGFAQRPDLASAQSRVAANKSLVTAAWSQNLPIVSASGGYIWSNFDFPLVSRWNAGLTVSIPIFQGFAINAQVDQARAGLELAQANLEVTREAVTLDLEQNFLSLKEASERIGATSKLVEQAAEALNLAEKQYAAGVASPIEVSDAQLILSNAHITRIQALYDYNNSLVRLKRAMGTLQK
jgi:outer membrane protein TolC